MKAGYARLSSDDDGDLLAVTRQRDDITALANLRFPGEPLRWYIDNDISASRYSRKPRPAYLQLCEDIKAGIIDGLIGYNLDRVWRRPRDLESFLDLADAASLRHVYTVEGDIDLSTHDGQFSARILVAVAAKESDNLSRRITRKLKANAESGRAHGGPAIYGWQADHRTIDPAQATIIRGITDQLLSGRSLTSITNDLNALSTPSARGGRWAQVTLKRMLLSPRLVGLRTYHGEIVGPGDHDPILEPDTWRRLCAVLNAPGRSTAPRPRAYPLVGLLICGSCGTVLSSNPHQKARRYACRDNRGGCSKVGIDAAQTEAHLLSLVLDLLSGEVSPVPAHPSAVNRLTTPPLDPSRELLPAESTGVDHNLGFGSHDDSPDDSVTEIGGRVALTERALDELEDDYRLNRLIDRGTYTRLRAKLTATLETDRAALARAHSQPAIASRYLHAADRLRDDWDELDVGQRATVYKTFIRRVVVAPAIPGRRFDAGRLAVELHAFQG